MIRRARVALAFVVGSTGVFFPSMRAFAAGQDKKACFAAADDGQRLRDDGKLVSAREKFIACATKGCPGVVSKECNAWLREVERDLPSCSFRALDEQAKEVLDVRVLVDGKVVSESIQPRAMPLDPGAHLVRFERADGRSVEEKIMLRPGEKNRIVQLGFAAPTVPERAPAPPPERKPDVLPPTEAAAPGFHVPVLAWVGLGVGVAAGGATAAFALMANADESRLRSSCAPACSESERSPVETKLLVANVALGVAVTGLAVAVVSTVLANRGESTSKPSARAFLIDVDPSGRVGVRGTF